MKISFIVVGKTSSAEIKNLCADYMKRIQHYAQINEVIIENTGAKITDINKAKQKEGELVLKKIAPADFVILLYDKGKEHTSREFAAWLQNLFNQSLKN